MTDIELLSARLNKLERRFVRIKVFAVLVCISAIAATTIGPAFSQTFFGLDQLDPLQTLPRAEQAAQVPIQAEVRANRFILVDENGKERASLVSDDDGSGYLIIFDEDGKTRINLSLTPSGPSLALYDPSGQVRTVVGSTSLVGSRIAGERTPASSIALFDKDGTLISRQ